MIYDRTQNDVDTAVRLRNQKVQNFEPLTEDEIAILERGTITINTLNRIEEKQIELKNLFNEICYWDTSAVQNMSWDYVDIFDSVEFERIIENTKILRNAFFVYKDTPQIPNVSYHWQDLNSLEKVLHDLDVMINDVKGRYKRCGTFRCGE